MPPYLLKRVRLLPFTCAFILLLNFVVMHQQNHQLSIRSALLSEDISQSFYEESSPIEKPLAFNKTTLFSAIESLVHFDFGPLWHDEEQKMVPYVLQRLVFSFKFLIVPWAITFFGALFLGIVMALGARALYGQVLYWACTLLYAIPLYVMIPLLIEKVALKNNVPIHGANFTSPYHYLIPMLAMIYGAIAIYGRLFKNVFEQILSRDYLLLAKMNHLSQLRQVFVFALREAWVTCVPLLLGSFNFFFSALIIVETLFEIDGFGGFFYLSILAKNSNATLFCIFLASLISMMGHWLGDVFLYYFDPRVKDREATRVY